MNKDQIMIEEILLGFIRSSNKIVLKDYKISEEGPNDTYTLTFLVDKNFGSTLVNSLDNQFSSFFKAGGSNA